MARILSIAPYKYLKPQNGGHWCVFFTESIYAKYNEVHTLSVTTNEPYNTPFKQVNVLSDSKTRYLPGLLYQKILQYAKQLSVTHITCQHHYLFPAAYMVAKAIKKPIYIRSHNIESERFRTTGKWWWKAMYYFEQYAYRKANVTFFISNQDAAWAKEHYHLTEQQTAVMPFATSFKEIPQSSVTRNEVAARHQLNPDKTWLVFMGILSYPPNEEAVTLILKELYTRLQQTDAAYEIIICGKGLNNELAQAIHELPNIHYLGFVEDLDAVLHQSQVMLNPVLNGGGVKTKVLEALAWNNYVVSTDFGAFGVEQKYCGNKLQIVDNNDWDAFIQKIIHCIDTDKEMLPQAFFEQYNIDAIADRIQPYFQ